MIEQLETRFREQEKNILLPFKEKAWQRFKLMGLPDRNNETYQYVRFRKLEDRPFIFSKTSFKSFDNHQILISNEGFLYGTIPGITILPMVEAASTFSTLIQNQFNRLIKEEKDPLALVNSALYDDGLLIYIPPKTILDKPIEILIESKDESTLMPRLHFFFGAHSKGDVIVRYKGHKATLLNGIDFNLEESARVNYYQQDLDNAGWLFDFTRAYLKRSSKFTSFLITNGSETSRFDYRVQLNGEGGDAHLNGLWMLDQFKESHIHVLMEHRAPYCQSLQHFKGALTGSSRSSFEGKIYVERVAQKTDSFQMNNNLLLSNGAQAFSKPNLEIFADDVKASHGSTVGQLSEEELFYLRTRGYSLTEAKRLLTLGFLREIIDKIELEELKNEALESALRYG